jgi:hypothetical protein
MVFKLIVNSYAIFHPSGRGTCHSQLHNSVSESQPKNVAYFNYLGSIITNDGRSTSEIKARISTAKAAFSRKKILFTSNWT